MDKVRNWKAETLSRAVRATANTAVNADARKASNSDDAAGSLKAS